MNKTNLVFKTKDEIVKWKRITNILYQQILRKYFEMSFVVYDES